MLKDQWREIAVAWRRPPACLVITSYTLFTCCLPNCLNYWIKNVRLRVFAGKFVETPSPLKMARKQRIKYSSSDYWWTDEIAWINVHPDSIEESHSVNTQSRNLFYVLHIFFCYDCRQYGNMKKRMRRTLFWFPVSKIAAGNIFRSSRLSQIVCLILPCWWHPTWNTFRSSRLSTLRSVLTGWQDSGYITVLSRRLFIILIVSNWHDHRWKTFRSFRMFPIIVVSILSRYIAGLPQRWCISILLDLSQGTGGHEQQLLDLLVQC